MHKLSQRLGNACRGTLAILLLLVLGSPSWAAILIYEEDFNTDGLGSRYTAVGAGGSSGGFWELAVGNTNDLSGFEGANYWGGANLDVNFGGTNQLPRTLTLPLDALDVSLYTNLTVTLLVAATTGEWESAQPDYLRIYAVDADSSDEELLEAFLPNGTNASNLQATVQSSVVLGTTFQEITLSIDSLVDVNNLFLRFDAGSTSNREVMGFDRVQISGDLIPEPTSAAFLLGAGLLLFRLRRRR